MMNFYRILGVPHDADDAMIKSAYRSLAKEFHPDRNPGDPHADELFKRVNDAYRTLSDPAARIQHDQNLAKPVQVDTRLGSAAVLFEPSELEAMIRERLQVPPFSLKVIPPSHWVLLLLFAVYLLFQPADRFLTVLKVIFFLFQVLVSSYWVHSTLVHLKYKTKFSWGPVLVAHVVALLISGFLFVVFFTLMMLLGFYFPFIADFWRSL